MPRSAEERHRARDTFEEGVAEIVSVQEAEEVFPDDFEDDEPEEVKDDSGINLSAFNLSTVFHSSFTSIDSSYQNFKTSLRQKIKEKLPASSTKVEDVEETYESFDVVDGNIDLLLTKNYARSMLRRLSRG